MSSFTAAVVFRSTDDWEGDLRVYEVDDDYRYFCGDVGSSFYCDVSKGMRTDLASIPRLLRWLFSPDGLWAPAAIVHDRLYRETIIPRSMCDYVLLDGMKAINDSRVAAGKSGIPFWQRRAIYYGVRLGGWVPYNKYAKGKDRRVALAKLAELERITAKKESGQ